MVRAGFPNRFGAGVITTSGALGILIPPSIVMVMYSVATNTSVGALFNGRCDPRSAAGFHPGHGHLVPGPRSFDYPRMPKASWGERWVAFRKSVWGPDADRSSSWAVSTPACSPPPRRRPCPRCTPSSWRCSCTRTCGLKQIPKVLLDSANMSAMLLYIITNAVLFSFLMTNENIPQLLAEWLLDKGHGPHRFPPGGERAAAGGRQLHGSLPPSS